MTDLHTHILPLIDDGSRSAEDSKKMLEMLKTQEIDTVALTPHFDANRCDVDTFLDKREEAEEKLYEQGIENLPQLLFGAEVKYYNGISRLDSLKNLRLSDSRILMLEMPFNRWSNLTIRELAELSSENEFIIVLAHIERYLGLNSFGVIEFLIDNGIYIQSNAEFFISPLSRRRALKMLRDGLIHFLGSDCHNLKTRAPNMGDALKIIRTYLGDEFTEEFNRNCDDLLKERPF